MIVVGAVWVDRLQRRRCSSALVDARPSAASARSRRCCSMSIAYPLAEPLPHRHDARDVHARRVHARDRDRRRTGPSCTRSTTSTTFGGGFDVRAGTAPARRRSTTCAQRFGERHGVGRRGLHGRRQPVGARRRGEAARAPDARTRPTSSAASTRRSSSTRPSASATIATRLRLGARGLGRAFARRRASRSSTADRPAARQLELRRASGLPAHRLLLRGRAFDPIPIQVARPADREAASASPSSASSRTRRRSRWPASRPRRRRSRRHSRDRVQPTIHYFELAPGVDPDDAAAELESAFLANGLEAESIQQVVDDAVAASVHLQPADPGLHGARPGRRRRRARRHQRARRRRATPADRRPARDRIPAREWCRPRSCSSRRSSR